MEPTCGDTMIRYARAYTTDCYIKLSECYNRCDAHDKLKLKTEMVCMLNQVIRLITNQKDNNTSETEDNIKN